MSEIELNCSVPAGWLDVGWAMANPLLTVDLSQGQGLAFGGVLNDDTNMMVLAYPGGARFVRAGPPDYKVEERFVDAPPSRPDRAKVEEVWRVLVESLIDANREVDREVGR